MSTDPIHVEVARALGWTDVHPRTGGHWWGREPHAGMTICIPRYDTSWCSVGPICERMKIHLIPGIGDFWFADMFNQDGDRLLDEAVEGKTPCEAIARLIVELAKQEKLPK